MQMCAQGQTVAPGSQAEASPPHADGLHSWGALQCRGSGERLYARPVGTEADGDGRGLNPTGSLSSQEVQVASDKRYWRRDSVIMGPGAHDLLTERVGIKLTT